MNIFFFWVRPKSCNSQKKDFFIFWANVVWVFSFVHKIVLFGAFPRAKKRALDRAFWCSPSCTKSCFLVLSLVPKIVLFGALPRAKNRALDRVFWCSPSCQKSCFFVPSFVPLLQLLGLCQDMFIKWDRSSANLWAWIFWKRETPNIFDWLYLQFTPTCVGLIHFTH